MAIIEIIKPKGEGNNWIIVVKDQETALAMSCALWPLRGASEVNVREFNSLAEISEYTNARISNKA